MRIVLAKKVYFTNSKRHWEVGLLISRSFKLKTIISHCEITK